MKKELVRREAKGPSVDGKGRADAREERDWVRENLGRERKCVGIQREITRAGKKAKGREGCRGWPKVPKRGRGREKGHRASWRACDRRERTKRLYEQEGMRCGESVVEELREGKLSGCR